MEIQRSKAKQFKAILCFFLFLSSFTTEYILFHPLLFLEARMGNSILDLILCFTTLVSKPSCTRAPIRENDGVEMGEES
ncbi:hypothetical protein F4810DRAFT_650342 [Camillea tinctor]|nr:hypothetical protein F4810DRAFT_650342 [Camillea tinctor]